LRRDWTVSEKQIEPPEPTDINIYHLGKDERKNRNIEMLPGNLTESQEYLNNDAVLCDALGEHIVDNMARIAELETDSYRLAVHQWELDRYLANY
jgi:L-glutamine synthetase (EC 6.3.1.2)